MKSLITEPHLIMPRRPVFDFSACSLHWHGAEEVEHREVADAMFRHMSNSTMLRTTSAIVVFSLFGTLAIMEIYKLIEQAQEFPQKPRLRDYLRAARQDCVPKVQMLVKAGMRYLNPKHSPLNEASTEQALAFLQDFAFN